jgi:alpha-glucosidase
MIGLTIPISILFAVAIAASSSRYPQALPDWKASRDIGVFYPCTRTQKQPSTKLALVAEPKGIGSRISNWSPRPTFSTTPDGKSQATISVSPGTSLYGTGEVRAPMLRNGTEVELWNTNNYLYLENNQPLYQSAPWVLAVNKDGSAFGVYADSAWRMRVNLQSVIQFTSDGPPFRVIVIRGPNPQEVLTRMSNFTGKIELPPLWALGYQQSRYSYYPQSSVEKIADGFRSRNLPCDVIWMDIDYMHGFRIFTFDPVGYPDPAGLSDYLHQRGFKGVWVSDPAAKFEPGYSIYDSGVRNNAWVKTKDGQEYHGDLWSGPSVFPDFTQPHVRRWWGDLYRDFLVRSGADGVENDMDEPSVFPGPQETMPLDNRHEGGGDLPAGTHAEYHNLYGLLMVKASREGILKWKPQNRPFVLSRSNFFGGYRYAATWTGDNVSNEAYLKQSTPMVLTLGLSLQPFAGVDIGGFSGTAAPDLWARWIGVGVFYPFARGNAEKGRPDKEPWAFGPEVEAEARIALQRRYRLLPYLYSLFYESTQNGLPVMRPLFFADPRDPSLRAEDQLFLLGQDLLVIPHLQESDTPASPKGIWRPVSLVGEDAAADHYQPDVRVRGGAIIPLGPVMQHTGEKPLDPLTLVVSLDQNGSADGWLYEDQGEGFAYKHGRYKITTFAAKRIGESLLLMSSDSIGLLPNRPRALEVKVLTDSGTQTFQVPSPATFPLCLPLQAGNDLYGAPKPPGKKQRTGPSSQSGN